MQDGNKALIRSNPSRVDSYSPGPIREAIDAEHTAVSAFTARHPEYQRLAPEVISQAMSTYRTEEEHETARRLAHEGVPDDWRRGEGNEYPDDLCDALGRF